MNLNEIRLPPILIADLYKNLLIELPVVSHTSTIISFEDNPSDPCRYLGNNLKKILIVVHYPDQTFLPDEHLTFLNAVLKACNLTLEDTAIVNFATFKPDYNLLKHRMSPRIMLLFGVSSESINTLSHLNEFEQAKFDGIATLYVPGLERLNQHNNEGKILKKKLWSALKQLFEST